MSNTRDWGRAATDDTGVVPIQEIADDTGRTVMPTRLVCVTGHDLGTMFRLAPGTSIIGRGEVELRLSSSDVSRRHARVSLDEDGCLLEDLGSSNGTFVNGARIGAPTALQIGDRIQIGNTILLYTYFDELEARMQQLQRIEAMAAIVGGLAHDFRNALSVIVAGLDTLEACASDPSIRETVDDMKAAATSATGLAKRLLNLGRREPTAEYPRIDLADAVSLTLSMVRRALGRSISIVDRVPSGLTIRGSLEELQQVFTNLLVNAKDAMPSGGTISICAEVVRLERTTALARHLPSKGSYVHVTFEDTGCGMDEATALRIFEPFFTTKPADQGTGLGLSVVHAIVKRHGGSILVESVPRQGTKFTIYLPLA